MPDTKRKRISISIFSSDPVEGPEWSTLKRTRVKQIKKLGYFGNEIKKETGVPRSTQYIIYKAINHRPGKDRPGKPLKLDQEII